MFVFENIGEAVCIHATCHMPHANYDFYGSANELQSPVHTFMQAIHFMRACTSIYTHTHTYPEVAVKQLLIFNAVNNFISTLLFIHDS